MTTHITVLRTLGPLLAKTWRADGTIKNYDLARNFHVTRAEVPHLRALYNLLNRLRSEPTRCIIRGAPRGPTIGLSTQGEPQERTLANFEDAPSHLFMVDVDSFECLLTDPLTEPAAAIREFVDTLPAPFRNVSYVYQLSGSCGHPSKPPHVLRAHLWFWLHTPMTCAQAETWTALYLPQADRTVHRTVQVNYTADPVMAEGVADPLAGMRFGAYKGEVAELPNILGMPVPSISGTAAEGGHERRKRHVDPREKMNIVGAVCRAYMPEQIVELFPEHFTASERDPSRITWNLGGGTPEGIFVCDDGFSLGSSHATSPIGPHSANLFDFIRAHVFGHLDEGRDPDADFDPTALPSYQACEQWARAQPEVIEQLDLARPDVREVVEAAKDARAAQALESSESRAARMDNLKALIARADTRDVLQHKVCREIARIADLDEADRTELADAVQARTKQLGSRMPKALVREWLAPVVADETAMFPHRDEEGRLRSTEENAAVLAQRLGMTCRYNIIAKEQEVTIPGVRSDTHNFASRAVSFFYSQCQAVGMHVSPQVAKMFLHSLCEHNQYNPVAQWIDSKPWDGTDRIGPLAATITHDEERMSAQLKLLVLRKWLIQAVAVALSDAPLQVRGVLVLQGDQGIGKTRWLQRLAPRGLVLTGHHLDPHNKDSVSIALSHWIVELGEIGSTMRKSDTDALKAVISQDKDTIRLPYAPAPSKFQRTTAWVGSVNDRAFLSDPTGNTRYWVVPALALDHTHTVDMQQVFAQCAAAWRDGEAHWMTREEMEAVQQANREYEVEDSILAKIEARFAWRLMGTDKYEPIKLTVAQVLERIGYDKHGPSEWKRATDALRKLGAAKAPRTHGGIRGWLVPVDPSTVEGHDEFIGAAAGG